MSLVFEPLVMLCPRCRRQHLDEGEWAVKPHRTHLCLFCQHEWMPRGHATVGVPLGLLSEGWLFDVAVVHGSAAEEELWRAWVTREVRPEEARVAANVSWGG